jgi:hypothetical protein
MTDASTCLHQRWIALDGFCRWIIKCGYAESAISRLNVFPWLHLHGQKSRPNPTCSEIRQTYCPIFKVPATDAFAVDPSEIGEAQDVNPRWRFAEFG